uniref:Ig-like domain-containing protein n=1 Tax=Chelonoidis abingdonii TaxID=106734 RepID=A0A8C0ISS4_CHEAB
MLTPVFSQMYFSQAVSPCPAKPLMVSVGEDALLPCHLSPRMNAEDMEVRWFRSSFPEVIHLYRDGKDQPEQQILEYQGRTELLRDNITEGSVVLRIHSIRPADEGQYSCFFQSSTFYGAALLELKVAGLGSGPHISIADYEAGGIRVVCTSGGWYPEPEMLWRDSSGQLVPSLSQIKSQQENGLFEAQISFVIKERTHPGLNCYIRNPRLNQEKESTIYIAGQFSSQPDLVPIPLGGAGGSTATGGSALLFLCLILVAPSQKEYSVNGKGSEKGSKDDQGIWNSFHMWCDKVPPLLWWVLRCASLADCSPQWIFPLWNPSLGQLLLCLIRS